MREPPLQTIATISESNSSDTVLTAQPLDHLSHLVAMATKQLQSAPTPATPKSTNGVISGTKAGEGDSRIVVIIYGPGQGQIVSVFASVLGKPYRLASGFSAGGLG